MTMAQSIFEAGSEIYGIWQDDTPVGLLAVVDMSHPDADLDEGDDPDGIYIWRLMPLVLQHLLPPRLPCRSVLSR